MPLPWALCLCMCIWLVWCASRITCCLGWDYPTCIDYSPRWPVAKGRHFRCLPATRVGSMRIPTRRRRRSLLGDQCDHDDLQLDGHYTFDACAWMWREHWQQLVLSANHCREEPYVLSDEQVLRWKTPYTRVSCLNRRKVCKKCPTQCFSPPKPEYQKSVVNSSAVSIRVSVSVWVIF